MSSPTVTIGIPTFRGRATIGAAIESVLAQTLSDWELVITDDQSDDGTAERVRAYSDPRIRLLRNAQRLGAQGNWNRCLDEARGRLFKLLPHDDLLAPTALARQVQVLDADPSLALTFSAREVIDEGGRVLMRRGLSGFAPGRIDADVLRRRCVRQGTNLIGEPGAVMFPLALARRVGAFDARYPYLIDMDYWFRLLAHGDAGYVDEPLASFRVSRSQWSVALTRQQSRDFRACVAHLGWQGSALPSWRDRLMARLMPDVNALARQVFYKLYLR